MHKTYFTLLLGTLIICLSQVPTFAQSNTWNLIFENDAEGQAVQGSKDELIAAIRDGKSVRIAWFFQSANNAIVKVEHLADAKFLTILSDKTVMAQIDPIIGQIPNFREEKILLKENLAWVLIASTNGKNDQMTRNMITGEISDHTIRKWSTKWYVKD